MNTRNILSAVALALVAITGAQAETYQGVQAPVSAFSRDQINTQAIAAARNGDAYAEGAQADVQPALASSTDRAKIYADAVTTAHAANQNLDRKAFVNSVVPEQYTINRPTVAKQAGL